MWEDRCPLIQQDDRSSSYNFELASEPRWLGQGYFDEKSHHFSLLDLFLAESEGAGQGTHPVFEPDRPLPFRSTTVEQISAAKFSRDLFRRKPAPMRDKPSGALDPAESRLDETMSLCSSSPFRQRWLA